MLSHNIVFTSRADSTSFSTFGNGALLFMAAVLTIFSFSHALADDELACSGQNLFTQLEKEDPVRFRKAVERAETIPNGNAIFWKIEKSGLEPSWLLGTMHVSDPRVLDMPEGFYDAYETIDTLTVELAEVVKPEKLAMEILKHPELTTLQGDKTLDHILPPDATSDVAAGLKKKGISMNLMAKMRPWFIYMGLQAGGCDVKRSAKGFKVLDQSLALDALNDGIRLVGLETPAEQFEAISDVPDNFMLQNLRELLALPNGMDDISETMIDLYDQGKVGMIFSLMEFVSTDQAAAKAFENRVITDRNKVMAERAKPYLDNGRTMVAVGAAHLPGSDGLVELLRRQGFTVTAVN
ncbi:MULTISPECIES: TraB/GumN family protein [unclassified Rhizobium]|uniref:TraB/GumN family protein n=1 Tax=unclassified Rhizobium TaxID=2613769 RepID=UPI0007EABC50|nr:MULTISPECIES: TraB/GumN family protein [unclassified Rhizobium]ANM12569.1 TraB family protein [Rhizobium sp. N324]ANM18972.1 TraB family protein [Rhizobium sp. N541]ANM25357.1 TraB family protein [Rhizobium sp. N941]OYD01744.1 TraB family protein [Rhizobium sp. N4311]